MHQGVHPMGLTAKGPPPYPSIASLESPTAETGHAGSPAWAQWWTHSWGCTKDGPGPALSCIRRSTHTLTTLACGYLPGSSRGYYLIATDALRLAQLHGSSRGYYLLATDALRLAQLVGASTAAVSHSRGTFVVIAAATTFLPLTPSGLPSW